MNQMDSDEVDVFVGGVEPRPDALSETSRFFAAYKQRPDYRLELEEANMIHTELGIDPHAAWDARCQISA